MNKYLRGVLRVFAGMILVLILIVIGIIIVSSITSKKLVYKLPEKKITIIYNDKTITGYTTTNMTYDMNEPKEVAERMGIETYIEEISDWFHNTTEVTCKK